ncbi:MAG: IclR family transcriptional regulator [Neofamilia sp.]
MSQRNNQSVVRAFKILETISSTDGIGVSDIAREVELNKSTAFGLIKTLDNLGYIFKNEDTDKYQLTYKIRNLAEESADGHEILSYAKPYLKKLSEKYGEIIHFVAASGEEVFYLEKIESTKAIRVYTGIGSSMPMYCTGVGKAILSTRSEEEVREYAEKVGLEKITPNTITTIDELIKDLKLTAKRGYGIDDGENQEELYCIGVPIKNKKGEGVYALSISMPKFRKDEYDFDELIADLLEAKEGIEKFY